MRITVEGVRQGSAERPNGVLRTDLPPLDPIELPTYETYFGPSSVSGLLASAFMHQWRSVFAFSHSFDGRRRARAPWKKSPELIFRENMLLNDVPTNTS